MIDTLILSEEPILSIQLSGKKSFLRLQTLDKKKFVGPYFTITLQKMVCMLKNALMLSIVMKSLTIP